MAALHRHYGLGEVVRFLAYDLVFALPLARRLWKQVGGIPASAENAEKTFAAGGALLVYPGGDHEVMRPLWEANCIDLGGRKGFIKLAIRSGVSVYPVVNHGSHETTIVLSRGDKLAKRLGLSRVRIKVMPLTLKFPWGITPAFVPGVPLPSKITMQVLEPMDWGHLRPEDADDPVVVQQCYDQITAAMQGQLNALASERPNPFARRG